MQTSGYILLGKSYSMENSLQMMAGISYNLTTSRIKSISKGEFCHNDESFSGVLRKGISTKMVFLL